MKEKLQGLQFLRGIASLFVLIEHVLKETHSLLGVDVDMLRFPWAIGIDLFFVISGFIIYYISADRFGQAGARLDFLYRRVTRVVPMYYLFTSLVVLGQLAAPQLFGATQLDWRQIISSYLFYPYARYDGRIAPVLSLGWTLNYEMYFYLLFFLFLGFSKKTALTGLTALILAIVIAGRVFQPESSALVFWTSTLLLEFLAGIWIAVLARRFRVAKTNWPVFIGMNLAAFAWLWFSFHDAWLMSMPGAIVQGSACALLVCAYTVFLGPSDGDRIPSPFILLGDSSYALYLSHRFPLRIGSVLWEKLFGAALPGLFAVALCAICIITAIIVYYAIERPLLRLAARMNPVQAKPTVQASSEVQR